MPDVTKVKIGSVFSTFLFSEGSVQVSGVFPVGFRSVPFVVVFFVFARGYLKFCFVVVFFFSLKLRSTSDKLVLLNEKTFCWGISNWPYAAGPHMAEAQY